ncbi:class I SAM-dependent methyltransferase [Serratia nematodiphila]
MTIDFHSEKNRYTYASREAHSDWASAITTLVDPAGKVVTDIGCGGGIYSAAWADLGAVEVIGVDFSEQMVIAATEKNQPRPNLSFRKGDALATGLTAGSSDIVFERALIHHLKDYDACFTEAHRVLRPGGTYIIQDRTPDDVQLPGAPDHLRGYFFERFPKLLDAEIGRRPSDSAVRDALKKSGFDAPQVVSVWETRRQYASFDELASDLLGRVGRSILHNLTDNELAELVDFIGQQIGTNAPIVEKDRWTIWSSKRHAN